MNTIVVTALVLEMFASPVKVEIVPDVDALYANTILRQSPVVMSTIVDSEAAECISSNVGYTVDVGRSAEVDLDEISKPIQLLVAQPVIYDINAMEKACMVTYSYVKVSPL